MQLNLGSSESRTVFSTYEDLCVLNDSFTTKIRKYMFNSHRQEHNQETLIVNSSQSVLGSSYPFMMNPRQQQNAVKKRVFKNFIMLSVSLFLFFMAFQSLQNLQSTMNSDNGRGLQSQAVVYAVSMVALLFLPDLLVKTYGAQRILVFMVIISLPFLASNYNPKYEIIMPSAILMGIAIGPLSAVYGLYANELALRYFESGVSESLESVLSKFNGMLSFFLESTQIGGNLISYYVLRPGGEVPLVNLTNITCGIDFQNENSANPNLRPPSEDKRKLLVSIFVISGIVGAGFMGFFVDQLKNDIEIVRHEERCQFILKRLFSTARQACSPNQMCLIPLSIFMGMELAFYAGDFTQAYIACSWGLHHIGFVTVCFGVCGAIMALLSGPLAKYTSLMAVIILGACLSVGCIASLFLWEPSADAAYKFFIFAGVWGMADAIWWSQLAALYGLMFPNDREAAFSNLYFWSFFGFTISFSYANAFRVAVKINILLCFLIVGIIGYFISQIRIRCFARSEYIIIDGED